MVALVTGASTGIGAVYARKLAERGHDLVLVARSEGQLKDVASEIHDRYGREAQVIPADLTLADQLREVEARVEAGVDVVVNNAGYGTNGKFWELPVEREEDEVRLNITALLRLSHVALRTMVPKGAGTLINVASVAAYLPGPEYTTYAASKAFVLNFTEGLMVETKRTGVHVQAVCPGFVTTNFQERAGMDEATKMPGFLWLTPDQVVEASLDAAAKGSGVCIPSVKYKVAAGFLDVTPRGLVRRASALSTRFL
jgi:short-subunit dehydrogenase